jgi:LysR family transcriptional regulator, regulator for genes of the gallate degradation pathway
MQCPQAAANSFSLRHVLRVVKLAEQRSIAEVANTLNCSTTAVAKSVADIERLLGTALFDRVSGHYRPTPQGEILARRGCSAWQLYQSTSEICRRSRRSVQPLPPISNKRVDTLLAVYAQRQLRRVASELGITENAVRNAIASLEALLDAQLFERGKRIQLRPTFFSDVLVRNLKLVRAEIRFAIEEIADSDQATHGRVVMGIMPRVRELILPRAASRLLQRYPGIRLAAMDGPATVLLPALASGELDFIVGPLQPQPDEVQLVFDPLFVDRYVVIGRADHPLANRPTAPTLAEAVDNYGWVVTQVYSIGRQVFRRLLSEAGLQEPRKLIETNSFSFVKGLLLEGDWIALSTVAEVRHEERLGELRRLPLTLKLFPGRDACLPISIVRRAHTTMPPAVRLALDEIRAVARELEIEITEPTSPALKYA